MRPSAQPFLWKWVLFAWEWKIISISKAEDVTSFWYRGLGELGNGLFGNTSVWQGWGYLSSLRGCKLQIFGIISGRVCAGRVYYKFIGSQVSLLRTVLKGIKKAKEERWKERRAKHSVTASLPELKLLQLSCAGCLWSFKAWVSSRLLFFRDLSEFPLFLRLTFPSLLHPPPPPPVVPGF